jgi:hypothetical protein
MNADELQRYVRELEIAIPTVAPASSSHVRLALAADPTQPAGYVDAGSLVSFVAGVSQQNQDDVLNSTLLAQLHADKRFHRFDQPLEWYDAYRGVLGNVGWVIQQWVFQKDTSKTFTITMSEEILKALERVLTKGEFRVVSAAMDALRALSDGSGRLVLFDSESSSGSNGAFQISAASETGGRVAMTLGAYHFTSTQSEKRFLWFPFKSVDTNFFHAQQSVTLNKGQYDTVRQDIINKLGAAAKQFVASLDI